jgi:hypothetical protein
MFLAVCFIGVLVVGAGLLVGSKQMPFDEGTFEFGVVKEFEGVLIAAPLPHIQLTKSTVDYEIGKNLLLVDQGKHGFPDYAAKGFEKSVRVSGSLIYRDETVMLEIAGARSFNVIGESEGVVHKDSIIGTVTLTGELVDTKCFLGVMRPGAGKVHRACAANCLLGGVPPGILVRINEGMDVAILLAGVKGETPDIDPQWAGRMIQVKGPLSQMGDVSILTIETLELMK